MSLVAYSDDSEEEDTYTGNEKLNLNEVKSSQVKNSETGSSVQCCIESDSNVKPSLIEKGSNDGLGNSSVLSGKELFSSLPRPIGVTYTSDVDLERQEVKNCTKGYQRKPVKISIPSLDCGMEEKEVVLSKKPKMTAKGSRLFAILPPPKSVPTKEVNRPLVPNVLTKKAATSFGADKRQLDQKHQKLTKKVCPYGADNSDSGDDSEGEGTDKKSEDFFSLFAVNVGGDDKDNKLEKLKTGSSGESDLALADNSSSSGSYQAPSQWTTYLPQENYEKSSEGDLPQENYEKSSKGDGFPENVPETGAASTSAEQTVTGGLALDEEALQRLGGAKFRRQKQAVEVIDINEDTIMPDSNEWLTKQLTVETAPKVHGHSHRKNDGPTTQQRRKHQITYLAFQAKEKELELKNQWSQNRMSRKQTQSKYGF